MKKRTLFPSFALTLILVGCLSNQQATETRTYQLPNLVTATLTLTVTPYLVFKPTQTATAIQTPIATANPTQALFIINQFLAQTDYCPSPCLWGIVPGESTLEDVEALFTYLGNPLEITNQEGDLKFYYSIFGPAHGLEHGLSYDIVLTIQNGIVKNLDANIGTTDNVSGAPIQHNLWAGFSPENVLRRYGIPSSVEFAVAQGPILNGQSPLYWSMIIYYEHLNLIFEYGLGIKDVLGVGNVIQVCPSTVPTTHVKIWLGKEPRYPPDRRALKKLEEVTSLSLIDFYNLVALENSCFNLNKDE